MSRRDVLRYAGLGALAATLPLSVRRVAKAQGKTLNVAGYGGALNNYLTKDFAEPFEQKTGIKVNFGSGASLALAKLQTMSGSAAQWDMINLTGGEYVEAVKQKLIVPYDYSVIDASHVPPEYKEEYGIKFSLYLFVMCWDRKKIPDDKAPKSWVEFWDTQALARQAVVGRQHLRWQYAGAGAAGRWRADRQAVSAGCRARIEEPG